jgi:hypothetical protein
MHQVHGVIKVFNSALWTGAQCEMMNGKFNEQKIWDKLLRSKDPCNIFMADPTIYSTLTRYMEKKMSLSQSKRKDIKRAMQTQYRLMVSGSSGLPVE